MQPDDFPDPSGTENQARAERHGHFASTTAQARVRTPVETSARTDLSSDRAPRRSGTDGMPRQRCGGSEGRLPWRASRR